MPATSDDPPRKMSEGATTDEEPDEPEEARKLGTAGKIKTLVGKIGTLPDANGGRRPFWRKQFVQLDGDEEEGGKPIICGICPVPRTKGDCITIVIAPLLVCFNLFIIVYVVNYIWLRQLD